MALSALGLPEASPENTRVLVLQCRVDALELEVDKLHHALDAALKSILDLEVRLNTWDFKTW